MATQVCQRPIADIKFVDECRQWSKASVAAKLSETPLDAALCAQAILETGLFVVPNALDNLRFIYNPFVRNAPELRFYAGAVIKTDRGFHSAPSATWM